jgi:hypothetical protein
LHWAVGRTGDGPRGLGRQVVTFEQHGLTYPLTPTDVIENWVDILSLYQALANFERRIIISGMQNGGPSQAVRDFHP